MKFSIHHDFKQLIVANKTTDSVSINNIKEREI